MPLLATILTGQAPVSASSSKEAKAWRASGAEQTMVLYRGRQFTLKRLEQTLGQTHCHDFAGGPLTCFATEREADLDLLAKGGFSRTATTTAQRWGASTAPHVASKASLPSGCHPYANGRLYDGRKGTGSSVTLYCESYPNLSTIGWGGRAKSGMCYKCSSRYRMTLYSQPAISGSTLEMMAEISTMMSTVTFQLGKFVQAIMFRAKK
ncbi:hypothetical protein [Nonomuraea sp. NPDC001699]